MLHILFRNGKVSFSPIALENLTSRKIGRSRLYNELQEANSKKSNDRFFRAILLALSLSGYVLLTIYLYQVYVSSL